MRPISLLALLFYIIFALQPALLHAQDEPCPRNTHYDEPSSDCVQSSTITLDLRYPDWLTAYPTLLEAVQDYLSASRSNFLLYLSDDYATFPQDRPLFLEITYEEIVHSENIVSLIFTEFYDIGGLYPLDEIHTFTFDLENEQELAIADVLVFDSDITGILTPFIADQFGEEFLTEIIDDGLPRPYAFSNFVLTEDALILLYPPARSGPTHAGMWRVEIPLTEVSAVLNGALFSAAD